MARRKLTSFFLYRRRIAVAYAFAGAALVILLVLALVVPGGLTAAEKASSVQALNGNLLSVNAPYYWLQKLSISTFGLSTFAIKLPSLILGAILGGALFLLLKRWLTLAISVFSALIIFSSVTFLNLAGTGSPDILYVLYPALLIFFGTRVLTHDRGVIVFALLLLITIALAVLTPTMIYLVALALGMAAFNPHVRYGFRRLPLTGLLVAALGFVAALAPLAYLIATEPSALRTILAIPSLSFSNIGSNIAALGHSFCSFLNPGLYAGKPAPLLGLATVGLAIIGLYRTIRGIYLARSQFIVGWSAIALILAVIDPNFGILLYLPLVLLASIGLSQLAAIWYRTFPFNPYARVTALLPIGVLIVGIVFGSSLRYVNTSLYADGASETYSHDLQLLQHFAASGSKVPSFTLAVNDTDLDFYSGLTTKSMFGKPLTSGVVANTSIPGGQGSIVSTKPLDGRGTPYRILTDSRTDNADRFYVYR